MWKGSCRGISGSLHGSASRESNRAQPVRLSPRRRLQFRVQASRVLETDAHRSGARREADAIKTYVTRNYSPRGTSQVASFAFVARRLCGARGASARDGCVRSERARGGPLHVASVSDACKRRARVCTICAPENTGSESTRVCLRRPRSGVDMLVALSIGCGVCLLRFVLSCVGPARALPLWAPVRAVARKKPPSPGQSWWTSRWYRTWVHANSSPHGTKPLSPLAGGVDDSRYPSHYRRRSPRSYQLRTSSAGAVDTATPCTCPRGRPYGK